jgi:hypothetical protein
VIKDLKTSASLMVNSVLAVIILSSTLFISISTSQYDPWLDVNDDGFGGIDDIVGVAEHFGQEGSPIKNVNVTNWPISSDVTVWWNEFLSLGGIEYSPIYESGGFGRLNVLTYSALAPPHTIEVEIQAILWNQIHTSFHAIPIYNFTLTSSPNAYRRVDSLLIPSGTFRFRVSTDSMSFGTLYLSFYLT